MEKIKTFEQFLTTDSAQFSPVNYLINLLLTALLAYLLGLLYNAYGNSLSNRKSFGKNFVVLAVATMIIITIVKSSLALSLGLVGALSIVRFRAAIKEPEELTFLFINIAIGLGFGADQRAATIIGFIFIALFLIAKNLIYKKEIYQNQSLLLTVSSQTPSKELMVNIIEILKQYSNKVELKRFDETDNNSESSYIIDVANFDKINSIKDKLQSKYENLSISFIDNNLDF